MRFDDRSEDNPIALNPGVNQVTVGAGLFRVLSTQPIQVTADTTDTQIVAFNKDGNGSPDPPKLTVGLDPAAVNRFINAAASEPAPE